MKIGMVPHIAPDIAVGFVCMKRSGRGRTGMGQSVKNGMVHIAVTGELLLWTHAFPREGVNAKTRAFQITLRPNLRSRPWRQDPNYSDIDRYA